MNNVSAARFMTEHLVSLGHTRIMHLGGDRDEQLDFRVHTQRLAGFRIALEAAGITDNDGFRAVPYTIPGGYAGALSVLEDERITMPVTLTVRRSTTAPPTQEGAAP